jgi:hypothetical protein
MCIMYNDVSLYQYNVTILYFVTILQANGSFVIKLSTYAM